MSCIAFSPRTVTDVEIFSLRLMEKVRTVYRALPNTGCCPVSCSKTCTAQNRAGYSHHAIAVGLLMQLLWLPQCCGLPSAAGPVLGAERFRKYGATTRGV